MKGTSSLRCFNLLISFWVLVIVSLLYLFHEGLSFEEVADAEVWNSDVRVFSVLDSSSSEILGYFYLDMYRRFNEESIFVSSVFYLSELEGNDSCCVFVQGREI